MSRDPQTVEREIEQAREQLASTLDKLANRTSPKSLVQQAKEAAAAKARTPVGMASIAAGAAAVAALVVLRIRRARQS